MSESNHNDDIRNTRPHWAERKTYGGNFFWVTCLRNEFLQGSKEREMGLSRKEWKLGCKYLILHAKLKIKKNQLSDV